ncbi:MAG TPA: hypothetical protein VF176_04225 [Solirubrobacterales bacterium]
MSEHLWDLYPCSMALLPASLEIGRGAVLIAIPLIVLPISGIAFARSGPAWSRLGKGAFAIEQELPPTRSAGAPPPVDRAVQAAEVRQMLEAKSYRRRRRGEPPLDIEAEMARVLDVPTQTAPTIDEELRSEVRQLAIARNERRMRRGQAPLDVEAEVERQLANFHRIV